MDDILNECQLSMDPNVFIFEGVSEFLFYNSELKTRVVVNKSNIINPIIYRFLDVDNLYTISLNKNESSNPEVLKLIRLLREHYMCDVFYGCNVKPVTIPPVMKCHEEHRGNIDNGKIYSLINEITFFINGQCNLNCLNCKEYNKQFLFCYKNSGFLRFNKIKEILEKIINVSNLSKLNFCGGNIMLYPELDKLFSFLQSLQCKSNFYIFYKNWDNNLLNKILHINSLLHIFVDFPIDDNIIKNILYHISSIQERVVFNFIITSEENITELNAVLNNYPIEIYNLFPFYNGNNIIFFKKYVYITNEDLCNETPSKKDIYKKQLFNINNMGKIIISSDSMYYTNLNFSPLGSLNESIESIIKKEWNNGKVWKNIRNSNPCSECIYQYMCPSPTNYETALGKANMCNIKD